MELWYIARFDIETPRYYLQRLSSEGKMGVYHWIPNRYHAMFFNSELSVGGYINTYMPIPRNNIDLGIVRFKNGEEDETVPLDEFSQKYALILHQVILT